MKPLEIIGVAATACVLCSCAGPHGEPPLVPSPLPQAAAPPTPAPAEMVRVEILSGSTHQAVAGARVVIGGQEYSTDQNGLVSLPQTTTIGADVDVRASGYLPRATRLSQSRQVTLWPVANDAEADAVHQMVFGRRSSSEFFFGLAGSEFYLTIPSAPAEVMSAWKAGAADFGSLFGITYRVGDQFQYETAEIMVKFGPDQGCTPVSGFCRTGNSAYMIFAVATDQATDPSLIRRVLASLFLGSHPLPGLLNSGAPAEMLSAFETQTIRMILQRPLKTFWPDNDRP